MISELHKTNIFVFLCSKVDDITSMQENNVMEFRIIGIHFLNQCFLPSLKLESQ